MAGGSLRLHARAIKCHSVALCHAIVWIDVACGGAWEVARGFLFQIDVTAIVIVMPPAIKP